MKHIMKKTIENSTSQESLLALMYVNGVAKGPKKIVNVEPVLETLIPIGPDRTARILVYEDDMETLKLLCAEITDEEMSLYGKGKSKTLDELKAVISEIGELPRYAPAVTDINSRVSDFIEVGSGRGPAWMDVDAVLALTDKLIEVTERDDE